MSILAPAQSSDELTIEVAAQPESFMGGSGLKPESQCLSLVEHNLSLAQLAAAINYEHQLSQEGYKSSLYHAYRTGEFLSQAKEQVKKSTSGRWLIWLKENCPGIAQRTAQAYMQVAREWNEIEKYASIADFGLKSALKLLSQKKVSVRSQATQASIDVLVDAKEEVQTDQPFQVRDCELAEVVQPNPEGIVLAISVLAQHSSSTMLERMDDIQLKVLINKSNFLIKKAKLLLSKRYTMQLQ
jgi:hypothetical protein